ncbi:MAG: hypothetical protein HQ472_09765 [Ignavibacteria bacterium]|nr:hypothetical protein [Ignavibacteria bacterium]
MIVINTSKNFLLCVFIMALTSTMLFSQQAVTRIEGKILDETTGKPIGCKILVYTPSGKKNTLSSNATDGTYLVVLNEAGECKFLFAGYNVYRYETKVVVPASTKFQEIKRDFKLREVIEGAAIASISGFEKNSVVFSSQANSTFSDLASVMTENQELNINVQVGADEDQVSAMKARILKDYESQMKAWAKAVKKVKKGKEPPAEPIKPEDPADPNIELIKLRKAAVKEMLMKVKNSDLRVSISTLPPPPATVVTKVEEALPTTKSKKGKKSTPAASSNAHSPTPQVPSLVIAVGKVKRLYD